LPQSTLSFARSVEGLAPPVGAEVLTDLLFRYSKAEATRIEGDALLIEVTPDRLDLLSEGGLREHVGGLLGHRRGLPVLARHAGEKNARVRVDPSVGSIRPAFAAVRVEAPPGGGLDGPLLAEAIRFQELLHATIGRDRRTASLGIYPWSRVQPPFEYTLRPLDELSFTPLDGTEEMPARRFYEEHPLGVRYASLGRVGESCLVLRDRSGQILSLPPALNSREAGEARVGDRSLLLESTGLHASRVEDALGLLMLTFAAQGFSVSPVHVEFTDHADTGEAFVRPRKVALDRGTLGRVSGLPLPDREVMDLLERARLGASSVEAGWEAEVPPWRPDLQSAVDLVEEVLLVRGVRVEEQRLPPSRTRGRRLRAHALRSWTEASLLGLGFVPLLTPVLVGARLVEELGWPAIALANPVSLELARLRPSLQISLLQTLEKNVRYGYPQRWSEVGPVLVRDPKAESGAVTLHHAGFLLAGEGAGFAEAAALVEFLFRRFGVSVVREPAEIPATIRGRAARVRLAGEPVAEIGEIHPQVLASIGVPVPAVWAELDLTRIAPLLGHPDD
jgi:phenylalanyl-tRNA synthetase beta chain